MHLDDFQNPYECIQSHLFYYSIQHGVPLMKIYISSSLLNQNLENQNINLALSGLKFKGPGYFDSQLCELVSSLTQDQKETTISLYSDLPNISLTFSHNPTDSCFPSNQENENTKQQSPKRAVFPSSKEARLQNIKQKPQFYDNCFVINMCSKTQSSKNKKSTSKRNPLPKPAKLLSSASQEEMQNKTYDIYVPLELTRHFNQNQIQWFFKFQSQLPADFWYMHNLTVASFQID